jgi:uncharacterized membrane protein (UPF0182 family)
MHEFEPERPSGRRALRVLVPLVLLVVGLPMLAGFYIDLRWYQELGHSDLFLQPFATRIAVSAVTGLATALVLFVNFRLARTLSRGLPPLYLYDPDGAPRFNLSEISARLAQPACVALAVLTGLFYDRHWSTWLQFLHGSRFEQRDPIFGRDVGFYVFQLPLYETACALFLWWTGASLVLAAGLYALRGAVLVGEHNTRVHPPARIHLSVLVALLLVALALRSYLDMFEVLQSRLGPMMTGASYADVHAKLPALRIKIGVAAVAALLVLASARREDFNLAILGAVLYVAAQAGVQVYPSLVHRFSVQPNQLEREAPYLKHNIDATRAAYGLSAVAERELTARGTLSAADIERNADTVENIRLWDHEPLRETFAQIQEIRTYYDFAAVDNDRYRVNGQLRQVMLSARELNTDADSLPNPTWINKRLEFTHGYGLTLGPVNETTPEGLPVLFVQDIPPVSSVPDIKVTRPGIYFGELSSDYVFVRTRNREFDYPSGRGNVETDYAGKGGIPFDSPWVRLSLTLELLSHEILLSDDIDADSRVLLHRNIKTRLQRIAPFLRLDQDPYLVVRDDGTLVWIYDAYTVTRRYPYSEPDRRHAFNYIRNSVKAVIDAYDGTVTLYVVDDQDPLLRTWRKIFPRSFVPLQKMPADIRAHLRYPELIFDVQTEMFATYHMRDAELLYNSEDLWEVPSIVTPAGKDKMEPYYTVMKLPGETRAEFILMLPFTPKRKDNLAAWMVARSDGGRLGELIVYRFPKDRLVYGPQQVVTRINQDAEIARQISLWNQRGSQALFGTLLVIPIEESLVYVRPLYLRSEGGKIPELKRVIVAYEKKIAMKPSLREAMDTVFGPADGAPASADTTTGADAAASAHGDPPADTADAATVAADADRPQGSLAAQALHHFERAITAQRAGDWAGYGSELQSLERALRQMAPQAAGTSGSAPVDVVPPRGAGAKPAPVSPR